MGHEVAAVLYLNSQLKVIRYMEMSHGTLTQASVYPREIVKTALRLDAAAIIMSHNHPSGIPEPSEADLALTRHLKHALALVDVRSEEHTSELQSLMRISYAVFCLKKKTTQMT